LARRRDVYLHKTQNSQEKGIHSPRGIRTRNPNKRAATDPHLRPRGHQDRPKATFAPYITDCEINLHHTALEPTAYWLVVSGKGDI